MATMIPAVDQAIRRRGATRRGLGPRPGKIRGPRHGRPGATRSRPRLGTDTDAGTRMRTLLTAPGAPASATRRDVYLAIGPRS